MPATVTSITPRRANGHGEPPASDQRRPRFRDSPRLILVGILVLAGFLAAMLLAASRLRFAPELFTEFVATVRSTTHRITAQWHQDDVWIAEVEASYELRDRSEISALPRACVLRVGPDGVAELHFYGAHEHQLSHHRTGEEGMRIGGRWIPPL